MFTYPQPPTPNFFQMWRILCQFVKKKSPYPFLSQPPAPPAPPINIISDLDSLTKKFTNQLSSPPLPPPPPPTHTHTHTHKKGFGLFAMFCPPRAPFSELDSLSKKFTSPLPPLPAKQKVFFLQIWILCQFVKKFIPPPSHTT